MTAVDILTAPLLERIRGRAAGYDRDNAFCHEDLAELAAVGYLKVFVPVSDGGLGLGLGEAAQLQRRLATAAPATALAINMHLVWTGVARVLAARGDSSLDFVLQETAQGELVHAFITRDTSGYTILPDWDALGMRASQSNTTVLDGAVVPAARIFRKLPVGPNADP
jgi:alkylation response protein AidB-like acyl-CoA dehydrogenase